MYICLSLSLRELKCLRCLKGLDGDGIELLQVRNQRFIFSPADCGRRKRWSPHEVYRHALSAKASRTANAVQVELQKEESLKNNLSITAKHLCFYTGRVDSIDRSRSIMATSSLHIQAALRKESIQEGQLNISVAMSCLKQSGLDHSEVHSYS